MIDFIEQLPILQQLTILITAILLTAYCWHLASYHFHKKIERHREYLERLDNERENALKILDSMMTLFEKRLYRMKLLTWALSEAANPETIERHIEEYRKFLYDWNSTRTRNIALVQFIFGTDARMVVHSLYAKLKNLGSMLELAYRTAKTGDTPKDLTVIESNLGILTDEVGRFSFDMLLLIQDGNIGPFNKETWVGEPQLTGWRMQLARLVHAWNLVTSIHQSHAIRTLRGLEEPYETDSSNDITNKAQVFISIGSVGDQYHHDPEFTSLANAIAQIDPCLYVQIPVPGSIDTSRRGLTWNELIYIYLPAAAIYLAPKIRDAAVKWAFGRIKDKIKKNLGSRPRPKRIVIVGPNGEVLKSIEVKGLDEVSEETPDADKIVRRPSGLVVPKTFTRRRKFSERVLALIERRQSKTRV